MTKDCSQKKGQIEMDLSQIMLHFALPTVRPPTSHPFGFRAGHLRARENAVGADYQRLDRPK